MKYSLRTARNVLAVAVPLLALGLTGLLAACGGSSSSGGTGTANVLLTDAPACGYDHVYVTVDHVEISADGNAWTTIPVASSTGRIDLLNLHNGVLTALGNAPLAAGTYQQVRLVLTATGNAAPYANAVVLTGATAETPLKTPSGQQSGYKIQGPFTVASGAVADLVLDFNACKSIVVAGASGQYLLKPVVSAVAQVMSGAISGTTAAGATVYAEQQSATGPVIVTGTVADSASGAFTLSPIIESSIGGNVDVVIVPPPPSSGTSGSGTYIVQNVPVTAGATTSVGTISPLAASPVYAAAGTITVAGLPGAANVVADQTVTASSRTYEIASTAATAGTFSLALAATGPWVGSYSMTLPIMFSQDTAVTDAGVYSLTATDPSGTVQTLPANVSIGAVTTLGFSLTP